MAIADPRGITPLITQRDHGNTESAIPLEGLLHPLEVKATAIPRPSMTSGISSLRKNLGKQVGKGSIIHMGELTLPLAPEIEAIPPSQL